MERVEIIRQKLSAIGEDYDALKPFMKEYLDKAEEYISLKETAQNEAIERLKKASYNVSDVSKGLGCSRTTLYNHNQLLKRYIEASIESSNKGNPFIAYEELKESKQRLQTQVNLMENRDIELEIDKHEKKVLTDKIKEQTAEIERLQARVHELSAELHNLKVAENKVSKI